MSITTKWLDDAQYVIVQTFEGRWTLEELHESVPELTEMMNSVEHQVVVISDLTGSNALPRGNVVGSGRNLVTRLPDNLAMIIAVTDNHVFRVFANIVKSLVANTRRIEMVRSWDEAHELVARTLQLD